jgi:RNA polymerase sigma-70 factor (ECF subfamily)
MNTTSTQMLERARAGNPESWRDLVLRYTPLVLLWCRQGFPRWQHLPRLCGVPRQDAEDVVQEVFSTVCNKMETFTKDGKPAAFRRWLYTTTRYKVLEYWGLRPDFPVEPDDLNRLPAAAEDSGSTHTPSGGIGRLRCLLERTRAEFEWRTWEAFWRVAAEGRPAAAVAEELGMNVPAVYTAKSRVWKRLREVAVAREEVTS